MVPFDFSYTTSYALNSNFCTRMHRLATIHSVQTTTDGHNTVPIIIIIIIKKENDYSDVRQLIAVARALYKIKLKTHMLIVQTVSTVG